MRGTLPSDNLQSVSITNFSGISICWVCRYFAGIESGVMRNCWESSLKLSGFVGIHRDLLGIGSGVIGNHQGL